MSLEMRASSLILLPAIILMLIMVIVISLSISLPFLFDSYRLGKDILNFATLYTDKVDSIILKSTENFEIYIPLGIFGIWRWATGLFKKFCSLYYKPIKPENQKENYTMAIITPVYNENPRVFRTALDSWQSNNPDELIAVIDHKDIQCIKTFEEFSKNKPWAKLIVTPKPGKRPSLAEGILSANSDIVALVDSDTIWAPNIKEKLLAPFRDPNIGGVTAKNPPIVERPKHLCIWQKMTDIFGDMRNYHDLPSQTATGSMLSCLSGRTSLYRRNIILPKLDEFLNEIILGKRKEPGEDKCLTRLIQSQGWKTYYQSNAEVYSSTATNFKTFWSQRVRWTRNSHNSDLLSLWDGWVWKHPYLAFYMVDRFISSFTMFLGPIYFGLSIYMNQWVIALSIFIWWIIGRGIKIIPHLRRKPKDILIVPLYVAINFLNALIKIYALVTMGDQKWIREVKPTNTSSRTNRRKQYFKKI